MCDQGSVSVPAATAGKPPLIGKIFRRYGGSYLKQHAVSREQRLAAAHIAACRTGAMGSNVRRCPHCEHAELHFNSCRDRHCPQCQGLERAMWTARRQMRALPVASFFVTFTVPDALRPVVQRNPVHLFTLMFDAASRTLSELGAERLGQLAFSLVLHTWSRQLIFHPHLHAVVAAGGLAGDRWNATRPDFLFPVARIRALFRKHMLQGLRRLFDDDALGFSGQTAALSAPASFAALLQKLWDTSWIVDIQPPRGKPEHAVKYLASYVRSVAISEQRIVSLSADGQVTFKTRGAKRLTLPAHDFVGRFLLHVLPNRLHKARHYGLYANGARAQRERARLLISASRPPLPVAAPSPVPDPDPDPAAALVAASSWLDRITLLTGKDPRVCPSCGRPDMILGKIDPRPRFHCCPFDPPQDSS